ncbi:conserved hypothetical protein [Beutenbergia cavernae DSM 12333]|uniref:Secreted protein n=2 Tax=Beutenbergia TaxID=84756 RepID=C5C1Z7_BEUC1|nr:conserved hypothetical protein [Beutenbergia cavernae DSM 12333]
MQWAREWGLDTVATMTEDTDVTPSTPTLPTGIGRRAVLGLAAAGAVGATALRWAPPATAADGTPVVLDPTSFRLVESERNAGAINKLRRVLRRASVTEVLDSGDRTLAPTTVGLPHEVRAWAYTDDDATTTDWYPQGITSTFDATGEDVADGRSALLTSWYDKADVQGARIAFIDITDPDEPTYRYVLLVEPYIREDGRGDFRPVPVHAGGLVWYGHWLSVVDTWNGVRVFDMRHLFEVDTDRPDAVGRADDGTYHAFGHRYVLPQALHHTSDVVGDETDFRFSSISLDRSSSPHSVVMAEYRAAADEAAGQAARVIRFDMHPRTGLLKASDDGVAVAREVADVDINSMQSATAIDGVFVISRSAGTSANGHLVTYTPPEEVTWYRGHFPVGTEDLTTWGSRDELWTLAEHPGQRSIVAVRASAYVS